MPDEGFELILKQADLELMGSQVREQPDNPFYHYTAAAGLEGILTTGAIWATDYRFLKDRAELRQGEQAIEAELDALIQIHGPDTTQADLCRRVRGLRDGHRVIDIPGIGIYVTSFSTESSLPHQWRDYADDSKGYAIGFKSLLLPTGDQKPQSLASGLSVDFGRCFYDENEYRTRVREIVLFIHDGLARYIDGYARSERHVERLYRTARVCCLARLGACRCRGSSARRNCRAQIRSLRGERTTRDLQ